MKKIKTIALLSVFFLLSYLLVFIDRLIMSPFVNVELPTAREINKFDYYKEAIGKRAAYYIFGVLIIGVIYNIVNAKKIIQLIF